MEKELEEKPVKEINVYPLSKGKRVILYLADFFLTFILAISLYTLAVSPLGDLIVGNEARANQYSNNVNQRDSILYERELLYRENESTSFSENMKYTCKLYVGYLVGANDYITKNYEVFENYYVDIRDDVDAYISLYKGLDSAGTYFDIAKLNENTVSLTDERVNEFKVFFDSSEGTPSSTAESDYSSFESNIFIKAYNLLVNDIMAKDLTSLDGTISYVAKQNEVGNYIEGTKYFVSACAEISYLLAAIVIYLLIPLINKNRKTLSMLILRRYRVDAKTLNGMKLRKVPILFLYQFCLSSWCVVFVPLGSVTFNALFSLPILFSISMVSLALALGSLIMLLFDAYNRDLLDKLTFSVVVDENELDKIYEAKGYKDL